MKNLGTLGSYWWSNLTDWMATPQEIQSKKEELQSIFGGWKTLNKTITPNNMLDITSALTPPTAPTGYEYDSIAIEEPNITTLSLNVIYFYKLVENININTDNKSKFNLVSILKPVGVVLLLMTAVTMIYKSEPIELTGFDEFGKKLFKQ